MLLSRSLKLAVLGLAVLAPSLLGGCDRQSSEKAQPQAAGGSAPKGGSTQGAIDRSHKGSLLPDFRLTDPSGKELRLAGLKGKPFLINLWATWCAPCVTELPMLEKLAISGKVKVLTVSQDMGQPEKIAAFLKDRGLNALEPWLDPENNLSFHYATGTLPTTVYYDAKGREVWRFVGERDWTNAETETMLAQSGAQ